MDLTIGSKQGYTEIMTDTDLLHTIPAQDWEATPSSVRTLLLSLLPLATEVSELRSRLEEREPQANVPPVNALSEQRHRVERYQSLVDRSFLQGLTEEEQQEMDQLGAEIDAGNAPFFEAALHRMEAAANKKHFSSSKYFS